MQPEELKEAFDQQAAGYDKQSAKMAPIYAGLHFLLEAVFADLPRDANVLGVGVGTGVEVVILPKSFPAGDLPPLTLQGRCSQYVGLKQRKWALLRVVISTKVT